MRVFGDSFYFIAMLDASDAHHDAAKAYSREHRVTVVTTRWVLAEVANALSAPPLRESVGAFIAHLHSRREFEIHRESDALFESGLALYRRRPDKHWSLTDCVSIVVMEREGLRVALTHDRHFGQAGFVAVFAE